jgi:hypothetical protein
MAELIHLELNADFFNRIGQQATSFTHSGSPPVSAAIREADHRRFDRMI